MIVLYIKDQTPQVQAKRIYQTEDRQDAEYARRRLEYSTGRPVLMVTHEDPTPNT